MAIFTRTSLKFVNEKVWMPLAKRLGRDEEGKVRRHVIKMQETARQVRIKQLAAGAFLATPVVSCRNLLGGSNRSLQGGSNGKALPVLSVAEASSADDRSERASHSAATPSANSRAAAASPEAAAEAPRLSGLAALAAAAKAAEAAAPSSADAGEGRGPDAAAAATAAASSPAPPTPALKAKGGWKRAANALEAAPEAPGELRRNRSSAFDRFKRASIAGRESIRRARQVDRSKQQAKQTAQETTKGTPSRVGIALLEALTSRLVVMLLLLLVFTALLEPGEIDEHAQLKTLELLANTTGYNSTAFNETLALYVAGRTPGSDMLELDECDKWYGNFCPRLRLMLVRVGGVIVWSDPHTRMGASAVDVIESLSLARDGENLIRASELMVQGCRPRWGHFASALLGARPPWRAPVLLVALRAVLRQSQPHG